MNISRWDSHPVERFVWMAGKANMFVMHCSCKQWPDAPRAPALMRTKPSLVRVAQRRDQSYQLPSRARRSLLNHIQQAFRQTLWFKNWEPKERLFIEGHKRIQWNLGYIRTSRDSKISTKNWEGRTSENNLPCNATWSILDETTPIGRTDEWDLQLRDV